ncbi:MAG: ABC transporter permease [Kiloniellales bacterium]
MTTSTSISKLRTASPPGLLQRMIWSGAGLLGLILAWWLGSLALSPIALPSPLDTASALVRILVDGVALPYLLETAVRVLCGFLAAVTVGAALGLAAGLSAPLRFSIGPILSMMLAVPPIAWVVLSLLWFGLGGQAVIFTVAVALTPIIFIATLQGMRTVDPALVEMAESFRLSALAFLREVMLPHLLSYLLPAMVTAFGIAWKVAVMAELLGAHSGIGSGLAIARSNLDTAESFAWILLAVGSFLAVQYGLIQPLYRRLEPWRGETARSGRKLAT